MHDVTKRGLALAVATGGLLITGAAPAVSAVSTHPGPPDQPGTKSQPTGDSSHHAVIPVSAPQVKQYSGRHKAAKTAKLTQAARAAKAAEAAEAPEWHAPAAHAVATHPVTGHLAPGTHHATARHHSVPHLSAPHHTAASPWHGTAAVQPTPDSRMRSWPHDEADGAEAEASDVGSAGLLAGNTVEVPVDAPVNVCGVVTTVLGAGNDASDDHCVNGAHTAGGPSSAASADSADNPGALSGNVVQVPVSLPTNICGDTVTAVGANNSADDVLCANEGSPNSSTARATAVNSPGLVSGNVVQVPVDAPLNLCGITANVVGANDTAAGDTCVNGGRHGHHPRWSPAGMDGPAAGAGAQAVTANSDGAVTGNIVQVPIEAPVNVCGDSVDVVGAFNSALDNHCVNNTAGGSAADAHAVGNNGLAAGNVAQMPIDIPTDICGVVAAVGAYHATAEDNSCVNTGAATATTSADTSGEAGIIAGNVAQGNVNTPVQLCGTAVAAGTANSGSEDTDCGNGPVNCPPPPENCPPPPPENCPPPPPPNCPPPVVPPPNQPPVFPPHHNCHHRHHRHHEEITELPHTGTDVLDFAGIGAGALLLGAGAVYAGRRRSGSAN